MRPTKLAADTDAARIEPIVPVANAAFKPWPFIDPHPAPRVLTLGDATVFVDTSSASGVSRDEVRAQARAAARAASFNDLYVG